jgi:hypothetical protein
MKKLALALALASALALPALAAAPDVSVRATRVIVAQVNGLGVAKLCAVRPSAPEVPLVCADVDNTSVPPINTATLDVTAFMNPGSPTCFRAIAVSPEGIQSVPSENQACGTVPAAPVLL